MKHRSRNESGNVAFFILLAIALFAALSFAVTRNRDGNVSLMTDQQAKVAAQEIIAYGNTLAATFQKLTLSGCSVNQFDISNTAWIRMDNITITHPVGQNLSATDDCKVFGPPGNALAVVMPANYFAPWPYSTTATKQGTFNVVRSAAPGIGVTANDDILLRLPFIKKEICMKINDLLGVPNPANSPPTITGVQPSSLYIGTLGIAAANLFGDPTNSFTGKMAFCIETEVGNKLYEYDHVLFAR